jgi:ABC-type glycerol-3-phosphate transport system substrate-binding protein
MRARFSRKGLAATHGEFAGRLRLEDVFKSLRGGFSYRGKLYALPFDGESSMSMYRKHLLEQNGLKMPEQPKYEDVKKIADALTDKAKGDYGITMRGKPRWGENMVRWPGTITLTVLLRL